MPIRVPRECIYFGVPMVVYPLAYDRPGNAAWVMYHGLGVKGNFRKASIEHVRTLVDRVDGDPYYRMEARLMQARLREAEDAQLGVKLIGAMVRERTESSGASPVGLKKVLDVKIGSDRYVDLRITRGFGSGLF